MPRGTTAGDGIQAITRLHCIGGGWDLNVIKMFTKHLIPQSLEDQTRVYLASLAISSTPSQLEQGENFYLLQKESSGAFNQLVASLASDSIVQAAKVVALSEHYRRTSQMDDYSNTSIIDSGASRHVSPNVNILDPDDKVKLTSFTGKATWTTGNGYLPLECHDDLSGNSFSIDIDNADHSTETVSTLLSMCKLLRAGWKFDLELGTTFAFAPTGQRVELIMCVDDVLRLPHTLREGDSSKQLPSAPINAVRKSDDGVNPEFLHQLFNHGNPDKIHRTLGVTRGFKQPHSPLPGCHCTSCASANARRKGLSHKQYTILNIGHEDPDTDEEMPSLLSQSEDESDTYDSIDSDSDEEVIISHHGPNFNQIEEGDGSNDEPPYEDEKHQVETNNCEELQDITKLEATTEGQTADQTVPRSNIETLQPFEVRKTTYTFIVDLNEVKSEVPEEKPDLQSENLPTSKFVKNIPLPDATKNSNTPTYQGASPGFAPEGDIPSLLIDNDSPIITENDTLVISPKDSKDSCLFDPNGPTGYLGMLLHDVLRDIPMELLYSKSSTPTASPTNTYSSLLDIKRQREYLTALGMLCWIDQPIRCDVSHSFTNLGQHRDTTTHSTLNVDSQNHRRSQNGLIISHNDAPIYWAKPKNAIKRSDKYKVRGVRQGFRKNTAITDVSTAFLQSESYPDEQVKYVSFENPFTCEINYYIPHLCDRSYYVRSTI